MNDGHRGIIQLMSGGFLDQLATQLRNNKTAACRRAIQRILDVVKKDYERGKYGSHTEAESDFRRLVEREEACYVPLQRFSDWRYRRRPLSFFAS